MVTFAMSAEGHLTTTAAVDDLVLDDNDVADAQRREVGGARERHIAVGVDDDGLDDVGASLRARRSRMARMLASVPCSSAAPDGPGLDDAWSSVTETKTAELASMDDGSVGAARARKKPLSGRTTRLLGLDDGCVVSR